MVANQFAHLSFIQRKPEPLGTEFKVVADVTTQLFTYVELQRGKNEMAQPHSLVTHGLLL